MSRSEKIKLPKYFNWGIILEYLNREPNEVMYTITEKNKVRRAFKIDSEYYLIEIECREEYLSIKLLNQVSNYLPVELKIIPFIKDWFDIDNNLKDFYDLANSDEILNDISKKFKGLRLVGMPDFYEAITWGILGQQINLTYTYTLKRRFTEKFGEKINFEGKDYWIYPDPEVIAKAKKEDILSLKLTERKAEYLIDISKKIAKGEISKQLYMEQKEAKLAEKEMVKLRGIGPWTANYVLMRSLRMGDAFPMADIGLLNGIKKIKKLPDKPDAIYLESLNKKWGKWSGYATFYIWHLLY